MTGARRTPASVVANTLMLWLAVGIASAALWPIYQDTAIVTLVVVTTALGSATAILGAVFRWSSVVVLAATCGVFLIAGVPLAVPTQAVQGVLPSAGGMLQLLSSVALGWKQLLTVTLPVGTYQGLLVPAFVLVLAVTVCSLTAALRSRRGGLAAIGPLLLYVVALALGPDYATLPVALTLCLIVVTLVWLMWRRWYARRSAVRALAADARSSDGTQAVVPTDHRLFGARTAVAAALILAIAGAAGVAGLALAPPRGARDVLRAAVEKPFDVRDYASPLAGFRQYLRPETSGDSLFTVTGLPEGGLVRIATLDTYDGIVYSVGSGDASSASGAFERVPYRFDQSAVDGDTVTLRVTVDGYRGVWVPTTGQLESVEFAGERAVRLRDSFYYNDTTGTAAVVGGLRPGDEYSVTTVVPAQPSASQLTGLTPGSADVPRPRRLPAATQIVLDRYTSGIDGDGERLVAMVEGLRRDGYVSHGIAESEPPSRSGHAADRITELLTDQRMIGDAEQYAVTAALMANQLGFPARVVFGFAPDAAGPGSVEVRGDSVSAWIEVHTDQSGWVTIDPTPPEREIPEEIPEEPTTVSRPQSVIPPRVAEPDPPVEQAPQETTRDEAVEMPAWLVVALAVARVVGWTAAAAAVVASPFLAIIAAKVRRRRRRRRASTPLARIAGGWQEYRDRIVDHGMEPPASATRQEIASAVGGTPPVILAAITDRAMFAPRPPSDEEADRVWKAVTELTAGLGEGATRWQRMKARISTRSLRSRGPQASGGLGTISLGGRTTRRDGRQGATP
jgi:transglutaminase-like putative cysteine protease